MSSESGSIQGDLVNTYALGNMMHQDAKAPSGDFSSGMRVQKNEDGSIGIGNFYFVEKSFFDQNNVPRKASKKHCTFQQWMGADAVQICYPTSKGNLVKLSISREIIIKRVANILDGSHSSIVA